MLIDIIYAFVLLMSIFKGYSKGLVLGIFSVIAIFIGLAAALKLSVVVANYLKGDADSSSKWIPIISFILVLVVVILIVGLISRVIKQTIQFAMLGWLDSLLGIVLYIILNTIIYSVILFYAQKVMILQPAVIADSVTYPYIAPWGPRLINNLGAIIPVFKNMFSELEHFFEGIARKHPSALTHVFNLRLS